MGLSATIKTDVAFSVSGAPDFGKVSGKFDGWGDRSLGNGVASEQADVVFSKSYTIAASGTQDIDLAGALVNQIGGAAVFAKVKAILIRARDGNTNNVIVGNGTNPFVGPFGAGAHTVAVPPGGRFSISAPKAGWAVTGGSADVLKLANSAGGTSVTVDVVIIGTSA